jgi:hypothetical protein
MATLYLELRFLLRKMREVRRLQPHELVDWSEEAARDWADLHLPHYRRSL